jgi:transposase
MPRYKHYDYGQRKFLAVSFEQQILPGTFEHTLHQMIEEHVDLSVFDAQYRNDETGAPAYDPAILLKIVLFAYSKGVTSSREIERLCRDNVVFMALSADSAPHFTTIADFISRQQDEIISIFRDVLLVCDEQGLIGKQMFAVDGIKLASNASKEWSGTLADFEKKALKLEHALAQLMRRHREVDARNEEPDLRAARVQRIDTLKAALDKVRGYLQRGQDKISAKGKIKKSNITDNDSAKIKGSKGVIQGYTGMAMVDARHQVIVHAQAFGEGQEHGLLIPMLEGARASYRELELSADVLNGVKLTADAGMHSETNLKYLAEHEIDGYVADTQFRKRDVRFADARRHKVTSTGASKPQSKAGRWFTPKDFKVGEDFAYCICPAGKRLYRNGGNCTVGGYRAIKFRAAKRDCKDCPLRERCLRRPQVSQTRQVYFFLERLYKVPRSKTHCARMREKIDSEQGRYYYSRRLGIVEPVFGNISATHRLRRFSFRGKRKVNNQWLLYSLVHNVGKLQRYGKLESRTKSK